MPERKQVDFMDILAWDETVAVGVPCVVRWTNSGSHYKSKAIVTKVNSKSLLASITEDVHGYTKGREIKVPRAIDVANWTWNNGAFPEE